MNYEENEELMEKIDADEPVTLSLHQVLGLTNGTDEDDDPLSWGSVQINKLKEDGTADIVVSYQLPRTVFEVIVRENFIHLNMDFPKNARYSLKNLKKIMLQYDQLCNSEEDIQQGNYYMHFLILPTALMGQLSIVLRNPVMWMNGEHPLDAKVQRMALLIEKDNCQFVSTEDIDMVGIRADVERELKLQYEMEEEAVLRAEEEEKEIQKELEEKMTNEYLMKLSGMNNDFNKMVELQHDGRLRFSDDKEVSTENDEDNEPDDIW